MPRPCRTNSIGCAPRLAAAIPVGFNAHPKPAVPRSTIAALRPGLYRLLDLHPGLGKMIRNFEVTWTHQIGTLGGGNHFIEICLDEADGVWLMLHSGSRGIGNAIGRYFIALAYKEAERQRIVLPNRDLAYLAEGAKHFDDYIDAVHWAQEYAAINRREMVRLALDALKPLLPPFILRGQVVQCHHNYVAVEAHYGATCYVTRKGAIRAGLGELGICPGSMGARSYIVRGKGAAESFCSAAHGAGRRWSREEAKRRYKVADLERQTEGVECRKDRGVLDECPAAYKDIDEVMANQADLVEVVHTLRQVVCVKG